MLGKISENTIVFSKSNSTLNCDHYCTFNSRGRSKYRSNKK